MLFVRYNKSKLRSYCINNNYYKIPYKKGDILILDNWKFAAGRNTTEWGPNGLRKIFRALVI